MGPFFVTAAICLCVLAIIHYTRRKRPPYPPGPKTLPILGNLRDFPREREALKYAQWAKVYGESDKPDVGELEVQSGAYLPPRNLGDIYHLSALGTHIIVVNSPKVADDLFVRRSWNYSDRNRMTMINEL